MLLWLQSQSYGSWVCRISEQHSLWVRASNLNSSSAIEQAVWTWASPITSVSFNFLISTWTWISQVLPCFWGKERHFPVGLPLLLQFSIWAPGNSVVTSVVLPGHGAGPRYNSITLRSVLTGRVHSPEADSPAIVRNESTQMQSIAPSPHYSGPGSGTFIPSGSRTSYIWPKPENLTTTQLSSL